MSSVGLIELKGLTASIEACDAMRKMSNIKILGTIKIGSGLVSIVIEGEISDVEIAIKEGVEIAKVNGEIYAYNIISNASEKLKQLFEGLQS